MALWSALTRSNSSMRFGDAPKVESKICWMRTSCCPNCPSLRHGGTSVVTIWMAVFPWTSATYPVQKNWVPL
eukprot:8467971-Heterocapsa_arctica.AAC.1